MSGSWKAAAVALLVLAAPGCVSSRAFMPGEHVTAVSPRGGHYAAEYPIIEAGQSLADVKIWSEGAVRDGGSDDPRTTVQVGFELENHGERPLRLDAKALFLEEMPKDGKDAAPPGRLAPERVVGDTLVPPGETRQVEVSFTLPSSVWPNDVPGYRVAWSVAATHVHSRKTPFLRATEPRDRDPWSPYYGPYAGYYYPGFYGSWSYRYRGWPPPWGVRRIFYYGPR